MQRKTTILVIDDDANFRNLLRIHLSHAGYALEVAEDGVEGGRAVLACSPDLVLCDLSMPYLDGFELLSLLRGDEHTASIPLIVLSGRGDVDAASRALQLGAADFLTKPVTREQLLDSVRACLDKVDGKGAAEE